MINTVKGEEIMKKLLIALMAISLIFGLASCKSTKQEDASETPVEQPQEPTDETVEDTTDESTDETDSFAEKNASGTQNRFHKDQKGCASSGNLVHGRKECTHQGKTGLWEYHLSV